MKRTLIGALLLSTLSFTASAAEEGSVVSPEPTTSIPKLASLVEPGEQVSSGDMISISRPFEHWSLLCTYRLSQNRRLCSIEQALSNGKSGVVWRVANSVDNRALLIMSVDPKLVAAKGVRLGFSDLEKTIGEKDWLCSPSACLTGFVFDGFLRAAIANSSSIRFSYATAGENNTEIPVDLIGSMTGFDLALKAGSTDPFGRLEVAKAAAEAPKEQPKPAEKKNDKKAEIAAPPAPVQLAEAKPEKVIEAVPEKVAAAKPETANAAKPVKVADAKPQRVAEHRPKKRQVSERPKPRNQLY